MNSDTHSNVSTEAAENLALTDDDKLHVRWVAWLHYLSALVLALLAIFVAGITLLVSRRIQLNELDLTPEMMAALDKGLVGLSVSLVLMLLLPALIMAVLGWLLARCMAYKWCMTLTGIQSLLLFPLGPILAIYTYKVTNRPAVKARFDARSRSKTAAESHTR